MVKRSRILKLDKNFKLYIMEKYETFDKFFANFFKIMNCFFNLGRPMSEEK